jgi:hypothetical protein
MAEQQFGGRGILSDIWRQRVIDVKGRDSRRTIDRFNDLLEFYRDRVVWPENVTTRH